MEKLRHIFATKSLRDKIIFTVAILVLFRVLAHIPLPWVDVNALSGVLTSSDSASTIFSILTGGAMENMSIILMGLTPYINAAIIMQLLAVVVPSLENLKKEGEHGQKKMSQYTRILTVPLAFIQSFGMILFINSSHSTTLIDTGNMAVIIPTMITVTAGTMFILWLGELVSEKGIGNGISLLIFAGIVSTVPGQIIGAIQASDAGLLSPVFLGLLVGTILLTIFVVYVSEGDRRVPVVYAAKKSGAQSKSFLPLKINQAGMIPIIFAISVVSMPSILGPFFVKSDSARLQEIGTWFLTNLNPGAGGWMYNVLYALLIFLFTYFYVSIVFDAKKMADNIQKRGGFIPGYRPGTETEKYLSEITGRLCFWGASFLSFVAIVPILFQSAITGGANNLSLFISGAGIIIVVSVVLDLIRRINAQLVQSDYEKL